MKIATFNARCKRFHQFQVPLLPDMSYGEFLFSDNFGQTYKYYFGLDDPNWKLVEEVLKQDFNLSASELGERTRQVMGLICDKEPGIEFYTDQLICPTCQSKSLTLDRNNRIGWTDIDELTFSRFNEQTRSDREKEIREIGEAWR